jgi:hypothetical protein
MDFRPPAHFQAVGKVRNQLVPSCPRQADTTSLTPAQMLPPVTLPPYDHELILAQTKLPKLPTILRQIAIRAVSVIDKSWYP